MRHLFILLLITGCAVPQKKSYYMEAKTTTLQCPVGSSYKLDGWCHYPITVKKKKKKQPIAKITCKQVFEKINQCMANNNKI